MRNSIAEKFESQINKCDICFCPYDRVEKQPVIICAMHHTVCKECMSGLEASKKCPFCREIIRFDKVVVNNYIYELLPQTNPQANSRQPVSNNAFAPIHRSPPQSQPQPQQYQPYQPNQFNYQPQNPQFQPPQPYQPYQPYQPPVDPPLPPVSINNQPLQPVY